MSQESNTNERSANCVRQTLRRNRERIMGLRNVVGMGMGKQTISGGKEELCIVVFVKKKMAPSALRPEERIPQDLDGVPIRVEETGAFRSL